MKRITKNGVFTSLKKEIFSAHVTILFYSALPNRRNIMACVEKVNFLQLGKQTTILTMYKRENLIFVYNKNSLPFAILLQKILFDKRVEIVKIIV